MTKNPDQNNQQPVTDKKEGAIDETSIETSVQRLAFYATPEHVCNYLPDQQATTLFADPDARLNNHLYSQLALYGFRRSGKYIYRPSCMNCSACIPVRLPVANFKPRKTQRKIWKRNQDLEIQIVTPEYSEEHFSLYKKYMDTRHPDGGMDEVEPDKYIEFLTCDWSDTQFIEFRLQEKLLSVAVIDVLETGLSSVYTFFDPDHANRSLGTLAVLWAINRACEIPLPHLYLGYWIEDCQKMSYKKQFQPGEQFKDGLWINHN